jgi:hypothetical protein
MSNIFDQFDEQPATTGGNIFDQFDHIEPEEPKVKRDGWMGTIQAGVESAGRAIGATFDAITGDNESIVERAEAAKNVEKDAALTAFYDDIAASRKQLGEDPGLWDSAKAVTGAMWRNKEGAAKALVEQLPNSAAALGGGWAGMKAGAAAGTVVAPGLGTAIGAIGGGLAGMFAGNAALEIGNKAIESAQDGVVTDEERAGAIKEGAVKAGVITGVDAVTLGASKWLTGATARAMEAATRRTLVDAGVDVTSRTAVEAARKSPEITAAVRRSQEEAAKLVSTAGQKALRYGGAGALETLGEGTGEYLGELAATGKADMLDAVLESALSAPQSAAEIAWGVSRNDSEAREKLWDVAEQQEQPKQPTLALPNMGGPTQYVFPDGSTTTDPEAARQFIETLPPEQRNAAYEQLLNGKWQRPADIKATLEVPGAEQADPFADLPEITTGPRTVEQRLAGITQDAEAVREKMRKERDLLRLVGDSKLNAELDRADERDAITRASGQDVPLENQMQAAARRAVEREESAAAQRNTITGTIQLPDPLETRAPEVEPAQRPDMAAEFERARQAEEARKAAELEQLAQESRLPAAEFDAERGNRIAEAAGAGESQPTAIELAMQRAQGAQSSAAPQPAQGMAQLREADRAMAQRLLSAKRGPSGTVTESAADIDAQVAAYAEGKRGPVFVDGEVSASQAPEGMSVVPSEFGGNYIVRNEDAAAVAQIEQQTGDKEIARQRILGYTQSKPDAMAGGNAVVVQARNEQGQIVKQELVDGNDPQAVQAAQESQAQAGAVEVTTPDAAMAKRIEQQENAAKSPAKKGPVPRGEAKSLLELVRRAGGIAKRLENDIAGEPTVRRKGYPVGVFREGGMGEDMLAELMQQNGYITEADVMGSDSGAEVAFELMRSALAGERVVPIAERERLMAEAEEKAYRDNIRQQAREAGIKIIGRKFSDLENDVLALRERQHEAQVRALEAEDRAAYEAVLQEVRDSGIIEEGEIEALIERNMNAPLRDLAQLLSDAYQARLAEINAELAEARAPRELNEEEYQDAAERENQGDAGGNAARASSERDEAGRREADQREAAPDAAAGREGFQLESQTERELKDRIAALEQAEAQRKQEEEAADRRRHADAERDSFTLTGSDRPADVLAAQGQGGLFDQPTQAPTASAQSRPAPSQRSESAQPVTVTAQRRVRTENGMVVEVDLSNGKMVRMQRLNGVEGMGLAGWHDIDNASVTSYLGDTKDMAIEEVLRSENAKQDRSRESRAATAVTETPAFRRWFGESKIVDDDGNPRVMYHGTTHPDIEVFRRAGTPESFLWQGPYFTSSAPDASANYAGVGPDLTSRIERESERIADDFHQDDYAAEQILQDYFDDAGIDLESIGIEDIESALEELKEEYADAAIQHAARKQLKGESDGLMMPVFLKVERPFDMTDAGRDLYLEYDTNEDGDIIGEERGEIVALVDAINEVSGGYDVSQDDIAEFTGWLYESGLDGVSPREIFDYGQRNLQVYAGSDGESTSFGQFWQDVLRETGLYDGMIQDADLYFGTQRRGFGGARIPGMAGVTPGTIHVVPFSPEQVKSATGNNGNFDASRPSILESRGRSESAAAISNSVSANTDKVRRLMERAASILGEDAALVRFAEQLLSRIDGQPISGRYTPSQLRGAIEVALNSRNPMAALNHESFHHALEAFFTPAQARIIKLAFAPGGALAARVKKQLRLDGETAVLADRDYLDAEELSAFGFQYYAAGRLKFGGEVGRIFKAMADMLERVRNWIRGAGFNTVEELFAALDQGKAARRGQRGRGAQRESRAGDPYADLYADMMPDRPVQDAERMVTGQLNGKLAMANGSVALINPRKTRNLHGFHADGDSFMSFELWDRNRREVVGYVELEMAGSKPVALHDIYVADAYRRSGAAANAVGMLLTNDPQGTFTIVEVLESARGFWESIGTSVGFDGNGQIGWNQFYEAREARRAGRESRGGADGQNQAQADVRNGARQVQGAANDRAADGRAGSNRADRNGRRDRMAVEAERAGLGQSRESRAGQGRQAGGNNSASQQPSSAAPRSIVERARQSIKWLDSILNPLGNMADQRAYLVERYKTMGAIAKWEEIGKQIYDTLKKADAADAKATFSYLTTKGATPDGIKNAEVRAKAVEVKAIIDKVGQALVKRGLISQASYEKYRDQYLPRMYLRYLLDDSINPFAATGAGRKTSNLGYTKERKDLPVEVREVLLGEVTDPAFLSATGIVRAMRDLFLLHWLEQISGNNSWVLPKGTVEWNGQRVTPHWLKKEAEQLRKQADFYDNPDNERKARQVAREMDEAADAAFEAMGQQDVNIEDYKQMPDTARYGRLRGLWVRKEIYDDIMGVAGMNQDDSNLVSSLFGYGGIGTKITQAFKTMKVTLNPASQVRNFVSNMVLLQLSGVPLHSIPVLIKKAVNEMANGGRHYQVAKKYGITESSFSSQELFRMKKELLDLEERMHGLSPWGKVRKMAGVIVDFAGEKYQKVEELGKVMKIIDGMDRQQLSEQDAVLEAQKWLFDYSLVPAWMRYARNAPIGAPFITFTMKVLPRLMETATTHPQRFLPWVGLWFGLAALSAASLGYDEDEMKAARESLPEWARKKSHVAILPFRDDDGRINYIDLGYHFPWTMWVDLAQNAVEGNPKGMLQSMGALSGPIPDLLIVVRTGIDPFTGQEVWNEAEPESVRWGKTLGYLFSMAVPPWLATNGPLAKLGNLDETDRFGDPKNSVGQAIGQAVGFPYRKFDPQKSRAQNLQVMQYELSEAERELERRLRSMQRATPEKRKEVIDEYVENYKSMAKEVAEYAKRSAMPAREARP